jgi:hypothetical protein
MCFEQHIPKNSAKPNVAEQEINKTESLNLLREFLSPKLVVEARCVQA